VADYSLRMRQLPRPEYRLMKALISRYELTDVSEMFAVSLRLFHEVMRYDNGAGEQWIRNVINEHRTDENETRVYEFPG